MKANELRIGNLILDRSEKVLRVDWFEREKICVKRVIRGTEVHPLTEEVKCLHPIPLTEEWLLKFGFEKCDSPTEQGYKFGVHKAFSNSYGEISFCFFDFGDWYQEVKYVHQLQNLYFALTGEELEIKIPE